MRNVLVGYDGSEHAERALERAALLAAGGAKITLVAAVDPGARGPKGMGSQDDEELSASAQALEAARGKLEAQGVEAHVIEREGDPARVVLDAANEGGADLIIVGTRGQGAAARLVLGSVSTKIVHDAPCDVLVVR